MRRLKYRGSKLFDQITQPMRDYFLRRNGLTPMGTCDEADVFLNSFPKSGSTWMRLMILGLVYGVDPDLIPFSLVLRLMPDVHVERYYARFATPMLFKSHLMPQPAYRKVIYMIQDGRDVMVSYLHQFEAIQKRSFDFVDVIQGKNKHYPEYWHEHVEAWLANPYGAKMLVLKYEEVKADPVNALGKVGSFLGIERDRALIERVVASTSFEKMRKKEQRDGPLFPRWPADKPFMRRGQVGSYRDEMPADALALFMESASATLQKCGYL